MANPLLDGQGTGVSPVNPVNDPSFTNNEGLNNFSLTYLNALTARFSDVTPFFVKDVVTKDSYQVSSSHELRTHTLSAPLLSPVKMNKSFYFVPLKSIMRHTWDAFFVNPKFGDDITDAVKPKFDFKTFASNLIQAFYDSIEDMDVPTNQHFKMVALIRNFFSAGSLLKYLGYSIPSSWYCDKLVDDFTHALSEQILNKQVYYGFEVDQRVGNSFVRVKTIDTSTFTSYRDVVGLLDLFETGYRVSVSVDGSGDPRKPFVDLGTALVTIDSAIDSTGDLKPWNICRLVGYQCVISHFYSNDDIDNISSSKVYLDNMESIVDSFVSFDYPSVSLNGVKLPLDIVSKGVLDTMSGLILGSPEFWLNLLCYGHNLRFGDYFVGSRTRPLAVGDVNINVNNNIVSVIDVTRNIAKQRFLNAVNRLRSSLATYTKGLFGVVPKENDSCPQFINSIESMFGNPETVNTADNQGDITSALRSNDGKYAFEMSFYDYGVLIGLLDFEVTSCYPRTTDRQNFAYDRFDMFNPMLQAVGDQVIYRQELDSDAKNPSSTFGYCQRYNEYKNSVNVANGGFACDALKDWVFTPDSKELVLSPSFVRFNRHEFDKYYSSLSYGDLGHYFHFILLMTNHISSNRPMDYQSPVV